jgi:hypothetical protein
VLGFDSSSGFLILHTMRCPWCFSIIMTTNYWFQGVGLIPKWMHWHNGCESWTGPKSLTSWLIRVCSTCPMRTSGYLHLWEMVDLAEPYKFGALRYRVLVTQLCATPSSLSFNLLLNTRSALRRNSNKILMFLHENFVWNSVAHCAGRYQGRYLLYYCWWHIHTTAFSFDP